MCCSFLLLVFFEVILFYNRKLGWISKEYIWQSLVVWSLRGRWGLRGTGGHSITIHCGMIAKWGDISAARRTLKPSSGFDSSKTRHTTRAKLPLHDLGPADITVAVCNTVSEVNAPLQSRHRRRFGAPKGLYEPH